MTTFEILRDRRADVLAIAQKHGVTSIRVFGPVVRGDDSADSDVDLLVTTGPEVSSWFPDGLILDLEDLLGLRQIVDAPYSRRPPSSPSRSAKYSSVRIDVTAAAT